MGCHCLLWKIRLWTSKCTAWFTWELPLNQRISTTDWLRTREGSTRETAHLSNNFFDLSRLERYTILKLTQSQSDPHTERPTQAPEPYHLPDFPFWDTSKTLSGRWSSWDREYGWCSLVHGLFWWSSCQQSNWLYFGQSINVYLALNYIMYYLLCFIPNWLVLSSWRVEIVCVHLYSLYLEKYPAQVGTYDTSQSRWVDAVLMVTSTVFRHFSLLGDLPLSSRYLWLCSEGNEDPWIASHKSMDMRCEQICV